VQTRTREQYIFHAATSAAALDYFSFQKPSRAEVRGAVVYPEWGEDNGPPLVAMIQIESIEALKIVGIMNSMAGHMAGFHGRKQMAW
jgi:hypothetical protein